MSAYKVQVKNASGELEDLDLAATYDGNGNEIAASYVKTSDLADGTVVAAEAEHAESADTATSADSAATATKLGSSTVGGTAQPVYLSAGTAKALSSTVGSETMPVYLNSGKITACSSSLESRYAGLEDYSWAEIAEISEAGYAPSVFHIGQEKTINLESGETVKVQILGFNHDELEDGTLAGITFGLKNALATTYETAVDSLSAISWDGSELQSYMEILKEDLPSDLQSVIKTIVKKTAEENASDTVVSTTEDLFLFSQVEIFGTYYCDATEQYSTAGEGKQYEYYQGKTWFSAYKRYGSTTYAAYQYYQENAVKGIGEDDTKTCQWVLRSPCYCENGIYNEVYTDGSLLSSMIVRSGSVYIVYGFCV